MLLSLREETEGKLQMLLSPTKKNGPDSLFKRSFWDLRCTPSSREKATSRGWVLGTVLDGVAPQEKKEIPFFLACEKR